MKNKIHHLVELVKKTLTMVCNFLKNLAEILLNFLDFFVKLVDKLYDLASSLHKFDTLIKKPDIRGDPSLDLAEKKQQDIFAENQSTANVDKVDKIINMIKNISCILFPVVDHIFAWII